MKMRNYMLVHSNLRLDFDRKVNEMLSNGFVLVGGVAIVPGEYNKYEFYQAIAKPELNKNEKIS